MHDDVDVVVVGVVALKRLDMKSFVWKHLCVCIALNIKYYARSTEEKQSNNPTVVQGMASFYLKKIMSFHSLHVI